MILNNPTLVQVLKIKHILCLLVIFSNALFSAPLTFPVLKSPDDIANLFPKSAASALALREETLNQATAALENLKIASNKDNSFETTILGFDQLIGYLGNHYCIIETLTLVSTDTNLRNEAAKSAEILENYISDIFTNETEIYTKIKECYSNNKNNFSKDQLYLTQQLLIDFEQSGQSLPLDQKEMLSSLQKEITQIEHVYEKNVQEDSSHFYASKQELAGLSPSALNALTQNEEGLYRIGCDYPTISSVLTTCSVQQTRKKLSELYGNRAYPENGQILTQLIEKRDTYANLLGYPSYSHFSLSNKMIQSPQAASTFLQKLWNTSLAKESIEFTALTKNLPDPIELTADGKLAAYDYSYVFDQHKKKHYQVDAEEIAQYFSLDNTFNGLMEIYEQFFNIQIDEVPVSGLWHEDVRLLEIREQDQSLIGYVVLDLFPRENKYSHACNVSGAAKRIKVGEIITPGLDVVVANFTKPTADAPSLLKHGEVTTLFHEVGHALHDLFSYHEYITFKGIGSFMKTDFVELPSQMLENWMWEPSILKKISSHYQTREPLSDAQINKLVDCKNANSGYSLQRQCFLSFLSLNYFMEGQNKNVDQIFTTLYQEKIPNIQQKDNDKMYAAFAHLVGYGPAYYGYLFTQVYSADVFAQIKKEGLLNPKVGTRYRREILEKGGSRDPNELLINFLGRLPNQDAFMCNLGLKAD